MKRINWVVIFICYLGMHDMQFAMQNDNNEIYNELRTAIIQRDIPLALDLINNSQINWNTRDHLGATLLHIAVLANNLYAVAALLQQEVDVNALDNDGNNALSYIQPTTDIAILNLLLQAGADPRTINNLGVNIIKEVEKALQQPDINDFYRANLYDFLLPLEKQVRKLNQQDEQVRLLRQQEEEQARRERGRRLAEQVRQNREAEQDRNNYLNYDLK